MPVRMRTGTTGRWRLIASAGGAPHGVASLDSHTITGVPHVAEFRPLPLADTVEISRERGT